MRVSLFFSVLPFFTCLYSHSSSYHCALSSMVIYSICSSCGIFSIHILFFFWVELKGVDHFCFPITRKQGFCFFFFVGFFEFLQDTLFPCFALHWVYENPSVLFNVAEPLLNSSRKTLEDHVVSTYYVPQQVCVYVSPTFRILNDSNTIYLLFIVFAISLFFSFSCSQVCLLGLAFVQQSET